MVFYSLVHMGYIRTVSVQLVPKYLSRDCSTDSFLYSERKNRKKTRLKQDIKSRKENQNVVVVANPPGSSLLRCRTTIDPLLHRYRYAVALLSPRCRTAIAPLSFRYRDAAVAPAVTTQSHRYHTAITPLSRHCCSAAVAPAVAPAVATQSHGYRSVVGPLLKPCRSGPERI